MLLEDTRSYHFLVHKRVSQLVEERFQIIIKCNSLHFMSWKTTTRITTLPRINETKQVVGKVSKRPPCGLITLALVLEFNLLVYSSFLLPLAVRNIFFPVRIASATEKFVYGIGKFFVSGDLCGSFVHFIYFICN